MDTRLPLLESSSGQLGSIAQLQLKALVETSEDAIATLDLDGTVTGWNSGAADLCGYTPEEAIGERLSRLVVPPELMHERRDLLGAVAEGRTVERQTVRRHKDGSRLLMALRMTPVRDELGIVVGSVWVARDVTDRKERERSQRKAGCERRWQERIDQALAEDKLAFAAQPLVDLRTGRVARFELLMRMRVGKRVLAPGDFLGHAERSGQIRRLDLWAVRRGIELARGFPVAINISAAAICDPGLVTVVTDTIEATGADPEDVTFEITETAAAGQLENAARLVAGLCDLGCGVALDDFGTGYGSLTYLHRLRVCELKIDREFIGPNRENLDRRVVEAILATARIFGIKTVAEGVEEPAMLRCLADLGVDLVQGFLLGRPTLVETAEDLPRLAREFEAGSAGFLPPVTAEPDRDADEEAPPRETVQARWPDYLVDLARQRCREAEGLRSHAQSVRHESSRLRAERPRRDERLF